MKKFYCFIVLTVLAMISLSATAKTITVKTDEASSGLVSLVDEENDINVTLTSTPQTLTDLPDDYVPMRIVAASGYVLDKITTIYEGGYTYSDNLQDSKIESYEYSWSNFSNGSTIEISVIDPANIKPKTVKLIGAPGSFYVQKSYSGDPIQTDDEGVVEIDWAGIYSFYVFSNEGYRLEGIKDQNGNSYGYNYPTDNVSVSTYGFPQNDMTLYVDTKDLSTIEYKTFTVNVDEDASNVVLRDSKYERYPISQGSNTISFEEGMEFTLYSQTSTPLYSVKLNGEPIEPKYNNFSFVPKTDDVVDVIVNYPEQEIPFKLTFAGDADASIITYASYNNQSITVEELLSEDFVLSLGRNLSMNFDNSSFGNVVIKVNGVQQNSSYSLNLFTSDENGYEIEISGDKLSSYINVTIETNDPEGVLIYQGSSAYGETYALTGNTTVLEIPRSNSSMTFAAAPDYIIKSVTGDPNFYYGSYNKTYYASKDVTLNIEVQKVVRDRQAVVYVEPANWSYNNMILSPDDYTRTLQKLIDLEDADPYLTVNYGDFDTPFNFNGGYTKAGEPFSPVYYVNGELATVESSKCTATDNLPDGSVIKVFTTEQTPLTVDFTVAEGVEVSVVEDLIVNLDDISSHTVLPGTRVTISPAEGSTVAVKVNDVELEADENSAYTFDVNENVNVEISGSEAPVHYDSTCIVRIVGDASRVAMRAYDGSRTITLSGSTNEVEFNSDNNEFTIESASYGGTLYSVEVEGQGKVEQRGSSRWIYSAANNDIVTINVNKPAVEEEKASVSFVFVNDDTENSIIKVMDDNGEISNWIDGFEANVDGYLNIMVNTAEYEIIKVSTSADVENEGVQDNQIMIGIMTRGSFSVLVPAEGLVITVEAVKKDASKIGIKVIGDPEGVNYSFGWSGINPVTLSASETEIEIPAGYEVVSINANPGYEIVSIVDENGNSYSAGSSIYLYNGALFTVTVNKEAAAGEIMVYVENAAWPYLKAAWNPNLPAEKAYVLGENLKAGYQMIEMPKDGKFSVSGYPTPIVFLNNENVETWDETHSYKLTDAFENFPIVQDGDVVKIYQKEPSICTVTYTLNGEDVTVRHDHVRVVENPSNHNEHVGTVIEIVPNNGIGVTVSANNVALTTDENGVYSCTLEGDTAIEVVGDGSNINGVELDNDAMEMYNLQGIKVNSKKAASGIYILNGKKIFKRN